MPPTRQGHPERVVRTTSTTDSEVTSPVDYHEQTSPQHPPFPLPSSLPCLATLAGLVVGTLAEFTVNKRW